MITHDARRSLSHGNNPVPSPWLATRMPYLHRYHGAVPPMALIAPFAQVTRSTNRSTSYCGEHQTPVTERYPGQGSISESYGRRAM